MNTKSIVASTERRTEGLFVVGSVVKILSGGEHIASGRVKKIVTEIKLGIPFITGLVVEDGVSTYLFDQPNLLWGDIGFHIRFRKDGLLQLEKARVTSGLTPNPK